MFLQSYIKYGFSEELKKNLEEIGFSTITEKKEQDLILNDKNLVVQYIRDQPQVHTVIKYLKFKQRYLVYIQTPHHQLLLINNKIIKNHQFMLISIFLLILLAFIILYIITIKKLESLKELKNKIKNLADENYDIDCATDKKDEISQLANEFDKTAKKLKKIKESRNIFIRNIMHELKTPITKGKILTQLPDNQDNNFKMQKVFYRLESLINEFATIEELISIQNNLNKKEYYLADIIDEVSDILMTDEENIILEFENIKIDVDFKLFTIAIKNLLDNGIKYSFDNKVIIKTEDKKIIIENNGDKLKYPFEDYFEPFFKGDEIKSNQSFGLGLYIVKHILDANKKEIKYFYKDNINQFVIIS
jgi:two-component system OmpR family sensor kinase